ncbi:MAG: MBL fold metallo-hydrolase [Solirubrobacterales bacterium]|nr:MBL fold metallo-hydrolase [Solirubrobacterales bacterium]
MHRLGSSLVNWYLVADDGRLTAVDAGLPGFKNTLEADLARLGHSTADIEALILTHSDGDHTGLARALHEAGARVLIHSGDEPSLRKPGLKPGDASPPHLLRELWRPGLWRLFAAMAISGGAMPKPFEGAETFSDGDLLDVPGAPRVIATPGHTVGHCAFHFERHGALVVGDALCTKNPITGSRGPQVMPSFLNVSTEQCVASLALLEDVAADVMLAGHGEPWRGQPAAAIAAARAR